MKLSPSDSIGTLVRAFGTSELSYTCEKDLVAARRRPSFIGGWLCEGPGSFYFSFPFKSIFFSSKFFHYIIVIRGLTSTYIL